MSQTWQPSPSRPQLKTGDVHLWLAKLDDARESRVGDYLSPAEELRAKAFLDDQARQTYIRSRGILRDILSRYLQLSPSSITIEASRQSKPRLKNAEFDLRFSLSHSHHLAMFAVTLGMEIGVDLERINAAICNEANAEPFLSEEELAGFQALAPGDRVKAFFTAWTRKEAFAKCRGQGLLADVKLVQTGLDGAEAVVDGVFLSSLGVADGYFAALATEVQPTSVVCWSWTPA
jgi:4'-phosphopantetheinyl transferase